MADTTGTTETPKTDTPPRRRRSATASGSQRRTRTAAESGSQGTGEAPTARESPPKPSSGARSLQIRLEEFFGSLAIPYATMGDEYAASLIAQRAPAMAEAWADLAKQNAGVRRVLERLLQGTAWGAVVISSASVAVPLLAHHGVIPIPVDPFAAMYGAPPGVPVRGRGSATMPQWDTPAQAQRVFVPEPPDMGDGMTPPIGPDSPPGTFTVAGSANGATMVPDA